MTFSSLFNAYTDHDPPKHTPKHVVPFVLPGFSKVQSDPDAAVKMVLGRLSQKKKAWWHKHASMHTALGCDEECEIIRRD
eukprot:CAMPEP_0173390684 /NCGR_PEP_ID=MMETSP1356-20130122/15799_1 /TAXON_ID=77927 ORGANISM="Hemiselmis virescens, Strain PCC157" /NCGR_SAMPLE_ID=MMETSP1356 /ASSEMBLY_ACC=CAM_ASM_000847 /LENGTH=79 /DNA_ID=CAMNT_0014348135 /DNA_START=26 /DNA_END=265 /DNA_ORIENTATION=-